MGALEPVQQMTKRSFRQKDQCGVQVCLEGTHVLPTAHGTLLRAPWDWRVTHGEEWWTTVKAEELTSALGAPWLIWSALPHPPDGGGR